MDWLRWATLAGGIALAFAIVAAMRLAWENSGSRTIVLATATLAGATLFFVLQVWFELQGSTNSDYIGLEYTINRQTSSIGEWAYADLSRAQSEIEASNWLRANNVSAFDQDDEKLVSQFAIFSLVSLLGQREFDWQLRKVQFTGRVLSGATITLQTVSTDKDSTLIRAPDLKERLSNAKNIFADAPLQVPLGLRLPLRSKVEITSNSLRIENPVCSVMWELQSPPLSVMNIDPRTRTIAPILSSGKTKYTTYNQYLKFTVTYSGLRSQRRDMMNYRNWTNRLLADSHQWFEEHGGREFTTNGVSQ